MLTHQNRLDELKATGNLPSPTGSALKILELARKDQTTLSEVATILKSDPALAGKVLRAVNSVQAGLAKPTADLTYATSLLGLRAVRRLVLAFSVVANSPRGVCHGFDYDRFWQHSLATALASQAISQTTNIADPEEAYTCGLLSQIGQLALATVHPQRYTSCLGEVSESCNLATVEVQSFGIDHNQLTAAMLADWGLPDALVEAAMYHENPHLSELEEGGAAHDMAYVLHFASCMADTWLAQADQRKRLLSKLFECAKPYELTPEAVAGLAEEAMADWTEWCSLLAIASNEIIPLSTTMQELQEQELQEIEEEDEPLVASEPDDTLRILVVDDDAMSRRYMARHLSAAGHELVTVDSALDALRMVIEFNPQVLITDWMMPEMDGLELCRTLRQSDVGRQVHVIMVTSHEDKNRLTEAFAAGCDDFLTKPVHPQELCARTRAASRVIRLQGELSKEKCEVQEYAAELSIGNRLLQREAWTDALTALPNRRYARARLKELWGTSERLGHSLTCLMIDVDHFKKVNDTYGHPAGDFVLQRTAAVLNASLRPADVLCRFGGEEFLVICNGIDLEGGHDIAERLREAVELNTIESDAFTGSVTVSVGVATRNEETVDADALLKSADDALYEAKRAGRNRVRKFDGAVPEEQQATG